MEKRLDNYVNSITYTTDSGFPVLDECNHTFMVTNTDRFSSLPILYTITIEGAKGYIEVECRLKLVAPKELSDNLEVTYKFIQVVSSSY